MAIAGRAAGRQLHALAHNLDPGRQARAAALDRLPGALGRRQRSMRKLGRSSSGSWTA